MKNRQKIVLCVILYFSVILLSFSQNDYSENSEIVNYNNQNSGSQRNRNRGNESNMRGEGDGDNNQMNKGREYMMNLRENNPDDFEHLMNLRQTDMNEFRNEMRNRISKQLGRRTQGNNDNKYTGMIQKYTNSNSEEEREEIRSELKSDLEKKFEKKQQSRKENIKKMSEKLEKLKQQINEQEGNKNNYIEKQLNMRLENSRHD